MSNAAADVRYQNVLQNMLLISTRHLTARTARFLRDHYAPDWQSPGGHYGELGWFFWVDEGVDAIVPHLLYDLMSAFEYAATQGASFEEKSRVEGRPYHSTRFSSSQRDGFSSGCDKNDLYPKLVKLAIERKMALGRGYSPALSD